MPRAVRPLLLFCIVLLASAGATRSACAQAEAVWSDAPLADALYEFADRTGIELVFAVRLVRDYRVSGRYNLTGDPEKALSLILRGTSVRAERIRRGQYVLIEVPLNVSIGGQEEAEAYTGTLDGRVVDAVSGAPLWGAHVWLVDLGLGDVAQDDGTFAVQQLPTGRYTVRFSFVGYRPVRLELDVFPDSPRLPPTIRLQPEPIASSDAVVEDGVVNTGVEPGVVEISGREARDAPYRVSDGDLSATLSWLPGLSRTGGASGAIVVRGADPNQTRTLRDGVPLYEPGHAFGLFSAFQPEALGRVRLHRGALPPSLSGALAAVIDVETTDAIAGDTSGVVDIGPLVARIVADTRIGRNAGLHISARRSTLGLLLAPRLHIVDGAVVLDPVGGTVAAFGPKPDVGFADAEGKISVRLRERSRLDLAGSYGRDDVRLGVPGASDRSPLDYQWTNHTLSARFRNLLASRTLLDALVYRSGHASDEQRPVEVGTRRVQQSLLESGASLNAEHYLSAEHELQAGFSIASRRLSSAESDPAAAAEPSVLHGTELGVYASDRWSPRRAWKVQPGIRFEVVSLDGRVSHLAISPRLSARWTPRPDELVFRVGISRQTQAVHRLRARATEGFDLAASRWLLTSRSAPLASAWQAGSGMEWAVSEGVAVSADLYGRWSTGLPEPVAAFVREPGVDAAELAQQFPDHDGRAVGLEVAVRTSLSTWTVGLTTSLSRTQVRRAVFGADWRSARYDRPVVVGLLAQHQNSLFGASARIDLESGTVRADGQRGPLELRAGLAVGMRVEYVGIEWGARVQATVQPKFDHFLVAASELGVPLATDVRGLASIPIVSLSARW